jgi:transposase-like protein
MCSFKDNSDQSYIADWVFEFSHHCTKCGHRENKVNTVGYDYDTKDDYRCPFCGVNWLEEIHKQKRK